MDKTKAFRVGVVAVGVILCVLFVFLLLPRLLVWFLPFVLAYFLSKIIEPVVRTLEKRFKIPRSLGAILGIVLAIGILGTVIGMLLGRLWDEMNAVIEKSDVIIAGIAGQYEAFRDSFAARFGFADDLERIFAGFGTKLSDSIASYTMPALRGAFDVMRGVPSAIVFAVVFFIATFFMSSDREEIAAGLRRTMPEKVMQFSEKLMQNVFSALGAYIRAQLIMICITFLELTLGFLIIGGAVADYALLMALIISVIDAIPILGTGTVLIPWGVYAFVAGDIRLGIMLIVLYLICLAVRQMVEPHLVARQIGLHPLLILMVMYAGLRLIGILGMVLGPVLALVVKQLYASGTFSAIGQYINKKEETKW